MSHSSHNNETSEESFSSAPANANKIKLTPKVLVVRILFTIFLWWFISLMMPFIPSPFAVVKGILYATKKVTDSIYFAAKGSALKESAQKVRDSSAEQSNDIDSVLIKVKKHHSRAFIEAEREDSLLRTELKTISSVPFVKGKTVNILIIGSDARLGASALHADAIHLFTISPDSGIIEITSVPRDTYCDLGYPDTTTFNHITNARAVGINGFLKRVEEICHRGSVRYYIEVGFSQVMGILELLGYKDPVQTLKFLRSRKTLRGGDIQRSHNQALFMRHSIIDKFDLLTGASGEIILTAGLQLVSTNLTKDFCLGLLYNLKERGFPKQRSDGVRLRTLPIYKIRLAEMLPDSVTIHSTLQKADQILSEEIGEVHVNVTSFLRKKLRKAIADSSHPSRVISDLHRYYSQKAWMQIQNRNERIGLRDSLLYCLGNAYKKLGKNIEVQQIIDSRNAEDLLYEKVNGK